MGISAALAAVKKLSGFAVVEKSRMFIRTKSRLCRGGAGRALTGAADGGEPRTEEHHRHDEKKHSHDARGHDAPSGRPLKGIGKEQAGGEEKSKNGGWHPQFPVFHEVFPMENFFEVAHMATSFLFGRDIGRSVPKSILPIKKARAS
jgi:hypothetical protein